MPDCPLKKPKENPWHIVDSHLGFDRPIKKPENVDPIGEMIHKDRQDLKQTILNSLDEYGSLSAPGKKPLLKKLGSNANSIQVETADGIFFRIKINFVAGLSSDFKEYDA